MLGHTEKKKEDDAYILLYKETTNFENKKP